MDPAGNPPLAQLAALRAGRGKELVGFERESSGQPLDRREPDFLFPAGLNLLEEVLGEIGNLGQLLLRQLVAKPELLQTKPNPIQGIHPSDRRDLYLTFLPAITWIYLDQMNNPVPAFLIGFALAAAIGELTSPAPL